MIKIQRQRQNTSITIRAATRQELDNYEKRKLGYTEDCLLHNKIDVDKVNAQKLCVNKTSKDAYINLDNASFKSCSTLENLSTNELFFIKCEP